LRLRRGTAHSVTMEFRSKPSDLRKYRIEPSDNLTKFESIYIPDLQEDCRKSDIMARSARKPTVKDGLGSGRRKSDREMKEETKKHVKIYEENVNEFDAATESMFGKPWEQKKLEYKKTSYFRKFESHRLRNVVVKGGDDLRQEIICMQLIYKMEEIMRQANLPVFIKPYEIIVLSENSGILEFVSNSKSIDDMKKSREDGFRNIADFFAEIFTTEERMKQA
jgi:hypothetical protein